MIIISDTFAVTSLVQIGRLEILSALYQKVIIPVEVAEELKRFHTLIGSLSEVIRELEQVAGFRISPQLKPHILQKAGEK